MKKKWFIPVVAVALTGAGFTAGYFFADSQQPERRVVVDQTVMEVYEELPVEQVQSIVLNLKNENVQISPSTNNYIRVIYEPSADGMTFHYAIDQGVLRMNVEDVESSPGVIPSSREMVYIYLPRNAYLNVSVSTVSGFIDIYDVRLGTLNAMTSSGYVGLTGTTVREKAHIETSSGWIFTRDNIFSQMDLISQSGNISVGLANSLEDTDTTIEGTTVLRNGTGDNRRDYQADTAAVHLAIQDPGGIIYLRSPQPVVPDEESDSDMTEAGE